MPQLNVEIHDAAFFAEERARFNLLLDKLPEAEREDGLTAQTTSAVAAFIRDLKSLGVTLDSDEQEAVAQYVSDHNDELEERTPQAWIIAYARLCSDGTLDEIKAERQGIEAETKKAELASQPTPQQIVNQESIQKVGGNMTIVKRYERDQEVDPWSFRLDKNVSDTKRKQAMEDLKRAAYAERRGNMTDTARNAQDQGNRPY